MWLDITSNGRVFMRRDLSKYRHIHQQGKPMKIIFDKHPSQRESDDSQRLIEIVRNIFTTNKEAA